jgi:hypothetical protein
MLTKKMGRKSPSKGALPPNKDIEINGVLAIKWKFKSLPEFCKWALHGNGQ